MRHLFFLATGLSASCAMLLLLSTEASAQYYTYYAPSPIVVAPAPVAVYSTPRRMTTYYAPTYAAPVVAAAPVTTYEGVVQTSYMAPAPYVSAYAPMTAAVPITSYYPPAYTSYYAPAAPVAMVAPVYVGPTAVVRSKVYYPGQPIRNTLRAITP